MSEYFDDPATFFGCVCVLRNAVGLPRRTVSFRRVLFLNVARVLLCCEVLLGKFEFAVFAMCSEDGNNEKKKYEDCR